MLCCNIAGRGTISALDLMSTPLFREAAEAMKRTGHSRMTPFVAAGSGSAASGTDSLGPISSSGVSAPEDIGPGRKSILSAINDDGVIENPTGIMDNIVTVFEWARTTFDALDLQGRDVIDLAESGAVIFKALTGMGLSRLWTSLSAEMEGGTDVMRDDFTKIFLEWMGIDQSFEAQDGGTPSGLRPIIFMARTVPVFEFVWLVQEPASYPLGDYAGVPEFVASSLDRRVYFRAELIQVFLCPFLCKLCVARLRVPMAAPA
jgi:hypothetical protein